MLEKRDTNKGGGDRKSEDYKNHPSTTSRGDLPPTLTELGFTWNESSYYRRVRSIDKEALRRCVRWGGCWGRLWNGGGQKCDRVSLLVK
jgi:hypothetical protein